MGERGGRGGRRERVVPDSSFISTWVASRVVVSFVVRAEGVMPEEVIFGRRGVPGTCGGWFGS